MEKNTQKNPSSTPRVFSNSNSNLNSNSSENSTNSEIAENTDTDIINKNTESLFTFEKLGIAPNLDFIHSKKKNKRKAETIIEPSSPDFQIFSDMEQFLHIKSQQKDQKQEKLRKIGQAKELLSQILDYENPEDLQAEILEGINILGFIHQKILNPKIQNPKETALKKIETKILNINKKLEDISKPTFADVTKSNLSKTFPLRPEVVIFNQKATSTLKESIHNPENSKKQKEIQKISKKEGIKLRRLILQVSKNFLENMDSLKLRNEINKLFTGSPVIASITKSQSNQSLVITTMENYSAKFLVENKKIWESKIPFTKTLYDSEWAKLIVHTVIVEPFHMDLSLLKEEIEIFNPQIKLMRDPVWISKEENRMNKKHSSILIHLENQEMANIALDNRLFIAGNSCKVDRFISKSTQCEKCQKFGHNRIRCRSLHPICQICAKNHETKDHKCNICEISGKECPYVPALCVNCNLSHKANDKKCEEWKRVKPKSKNIPKNILKARIPAETGSMDLE